MTHSNFLYLFNIFEGCVLLSTKSWIVVSFIMFSCFVLNTNLEDFRIKINRDKRVESDVKSMGACIDSKIEFFKEYELLILLVVEKI